jgi:hypothetical protein
MMSKILKEVDAPQIIKPEQPNILQIFNPQEKRPCSQEVTTSKQPMFWKPKAQSRRKQSWFGCFRPSKDIKN